MGKNNYGKYIWKDLLAYKKNTGYLVLYDSKDI